MTGLRNPQIEGRRGEIERRGKTGFGERAATGEEGNRR